MLADGRISMRVRPEVSELSSEGSVKLNGFNVPALTTRRAETTVELGSGQSFMIAGLLRNTQHQQHRQGAVPRRPADPRRAVPLDQVSAATETELVIIVTPYLVRPVSSQLALPTDGYRAPTDVERSSSKARPITGVSGPRRPAAPAPAVTGAAAGAAAAAPGFKL